MAEPGGGGQARPASDGPRRVEEMRDSRGLGRPGHRRGKTWAPGKGRGRAGRRVVLEII